MSVPSFPRRLAATLALLALHPGQWRYVPAWLWSLRPPRDPLRDQRPLYTFAATARLRRLLGWNTELRVLEFGSGGSTLFYARRVGEVVSVEHDAAWFQRVEKALAENDRQDNWTVVEPLSLYATPRLREPESVTPESTGPTSDVEVYRGQHFRSYVAVLEEFPDGHFDLIAVDGRARMACLAAARRKVKPGGWVLLDDSQREKYAATREIMAGCERNVYPGLNPYSLDWSETTLWRVGEGG